MTLLSVCGHSVRGMVVATATTLAVSGTTVAVAGWAEAATGPPPGTAAASERAAASVGGTSLAARSAAAARASAARIAAQEAAPAEPAARKAAATKARAAAAARKKAAAAARERSSAKAGRSTARTGDPRAIARAQVADRGWSAAQFRCLDALWERESGWRVRAENSSSGAYGIPQALPGRKMASAGGDWRTNAETQIEWGLDYIADRYGSPCRASASSSNKGWY